MILIILKRNSAIIPIEDPTMLPMYAFFSVHKGINNIIHKLQYFLLRFYLLLLLSVCNVFNHSSKGINCQACIPFICR